MSENVLYNISFVSVILGNFFPFFSIIGFIRHRDFYKKLHIVSTFNKYGMSFMLFAIVVNGCYTTVFTLYVIHCFAKTLILSVVEYVVKSRVNVIREKTTKLKEQILKEKISITQ